MVDQADSVSLRLGHWEAMSQDSFRPWTVRATARLSPTIVWLGSVSLLTAMSSAMVYGLLPVFLVKVLGASALVVGTLEGAAEATNSFMKILSGVISDQVGRRKPLLVFGYALSAFNKLLFPLATAVGVVAIARVVDRIGKGIRDAPRDAFLTDITPTEIRGSGFGLRLSFYTVGFVLGPVTAIGLMMLSGDNFRLVFAAAVVPAFAAIVVLLWAVQEKSVRQLPGTHWWPIRFGDWRRFSTTFWWWIAIASLLSVARFSHAFLVLKAHAVGVDAGFVPIIIVLIHTVYAVAAYPFGALADRLDRRVQLAGGILVLIAADVILMGAGSFEVTALGAMLWGLQFAVTQGLLAASIADAAPADLRGTAFGIYELAVGIATFIASAAAGALWVVGGATLAFASGAFIAAATLVLLLGRSRRAA
jgi:MFS family permease